MKIKNGKLIQAVKQVARWGRYWGNRLFNPSEYRRHRRLANYEIPGGYERIYFYHIRKTAGTSLNYAFLDHGVDAPDQIYERLNAKGRAQSGDKVFVRRKYYIEKGLYYYGFSHIPYHELRLPSNTFTITTFRDPVRRVVSHYKMLRWYDREGIDHPCMEVEGEWLGDSFRDFIEAMPKKHLFRQLYMFSPKYEVKEALENIKQLKFLMFVESMDADLDELQRQIEAELTLRKKKVSVAAPHIEDNILADLRELLEPEYRLLERVKAAK